VVSAVPSPFLVVGESLVDVVIPADGSGTLEAVGGSCLNVAVGLARLDVLTTLVTRLGDDRRGELVLAHVRDSGVTLAEGPVAGAATSTATAHLDESSAATYDFEIEWDLPPQRLSEDVSGIHVGSLGTRLPPGRDIVVDLVDQAREAEVFVSYDPNMRPFFVEDAASAWREVSEVAAGACLVKLSDEDLRLLRPGATEDDVCRELLAGARTELVVLTRGREGARAFTEGAALDIKAPPTDVVDTVGAGDSFMAAMLAMLSDWGVVDDGEGALQALDDARVELLVRGAVTAAAVTCSRRGANPPRRRELPPTWPAG
jgi:fructokinase